MKKLLFLIALTFLTIFVKAQVLNAKQNVENNLKTLYPTAIVESNSEFVYDITSNSLKTPPSEAGKIKVVDGYSWVIFNEDGTYCVGMTVVYYHVIWGIPICSGHIASGGYCL